MDANKNTNFAVAAQDTEKESDKQKEQYNDSDFQENEGIGNEDESESYVKNDPKNNHPETQDAQPNNTGASVRQPQKKGKLEQLPKNAAGNETPKHYFDSIKADEYFMPTVFEVEIHLPDNQVKIITVEVEKCARKKPYLGGYRNTSTESEYHNAFSQTDQIATYHKDKNHREVQTYQYKTKSSIMMREFGTQMEKEGLHIDTRDDVILSPKPYFSSEMWEKRREEKTLVIQRFVRGWLARTQASDLREHRARREREILEKEEELRRQEEMKHKEEIERRMHPRKYQDFEILFNELEVWRLNENNKISQSTELSEEEKKLAYNQLLQKETKILQQIDRLKITANTLNREERISKFLAAMSDAKLWKRTDGRFTEVHTPFTTRAKELMELYNGLKLPFLTIDERLDVLLHTKWTVKEFDCNLTREIVDLIDREADMLNRGRGETSLEGLRKRLANLFLQFIETPEFNPEAARFQKVPRELLQQTQSVIFE